MGELGQRLDEAHQQHQHGHQPSAVQPLPLHRPGAAEQGEGERRLHRQGRSRGRWAGCAATDPGVLRWRLAQGSSSPWRATLRCAARSSGWRSANACNCRAASRLGGQPGIPRRQIAPPAQRNSAARTAPATSRPRAMDGSIRNNPRITPSGVTNAAISGPSRCAGMPIACITGRAGLGRRDPAQRRRRQARQRATRLRTSPAASEPPAAKPRRRARYCNSACARLKPSNAATQRQGNAPSANQASTNGTSNTPQAASSSAARDCPGARPAQRGTAVFGQRTHSSEQGHAATSAPFCSRHKRA